MQEHGIASPEAEAEKPVNWWDVGNERRGQSALAKWSYGSATHAQPTCCLFKGNSTYIFSTMADYTTTNNLHSMLFNKNAVGFRGRYWA